MDVNLPEIERKWQKRWEREKAFEPKTDKSKKKAMMAIPYPYTSGPLHIGHGRTYTLSDVWLRWKRMNGFNALWPMGFHISGTPIVAVSKKIQDGDKATIELYSDYVGQYIKNDKEAKRIVESFSNPQNVADFFSSVIIDDFKSIGVSVDWTRRFTTGDRDYNKFVEWQFYTLRDKGLVKRGSHPVQFCLNCQSAVGEDDIRDGDILDTSIQEFTAIKFPFQEGFIVAATLRPETIFGLTNLWVNPDSVYVKIKTNDEVLYVSEEAAKKLEHQMKFEVIEKLKGTDLVWKKCLSPVESREVPILPASFVNPAGASGIVYSVPAHAPFDFAALRDIQASDARARNIKPISIIKISSFGEFPAKEICESLGVKNQDDRERLDEATKKIYKEEFYNGVLKENCQRFAGTAINSIKDEVKSWLKSSRKSFPFFESETKSLTCRDGGNVVVKLLDNQGFIDYGNAQWKAKAEKCLKGMRIVPDHYRKLFEHTIGWLHERACARKKGLGTRLPWDTEWVIESLSDSTIYPAFYLVVKKLRENKISPDSMKPAFFDYVFLGKGDLKAVSKETGIKETLVSEMRGEFDYWYPLDERHTAVAHITNHLTFYIFNHVAIFPEQKWPKSITLNELVIRDGAKMSKSKGNVIPLTDLSLKYSADLFRLYAVSSADIDSVLDWSDKSAESAKKRLLKLFSLCESVKNARELEERDIDRWLLSRFHGTLRDTEGMIDNYAMRDYCQRMFFDMINDFSYYMKRGEVNGKTAKEVFSSWLKALSPIIPHSCEEMWESLEQGGFVSLSQWPSFNERLIDSKAEKKEDLVSRILGDVEEIKKIAKMDPKSVVVFTSQSWKYACYSIIAGGGTMNEAMKDPEIRQRGKDAAPFIQSLIKKKFELSKDILSKDEELSAMESAKEFLGKELGCSVAIEDGDAVTHPKARLAEPGKPGILLG
ncbi:MAG: leucine--tRNA ligase [Candidatus Aenigmarchaeota archaeon]|nr:leucine--tRNA ligase [Candidatus Aenigmarchaeota archaeon]